MGEVRLVRENPSLGNFDPPSYPPAIHRIGGQVVARGRVQRAAGPGGANPLCYPSPRMSRTNLLDLLPDELEALAESLGAPRYRGRQLAGVDLRQGRLRYRTRCRICPGSSASPWPSAPRLSSPRWSGVTPSQDGSEKLVVRMADGARIQSVLMPDEDRLTLCSPRRWAAASAAPSASRAPWGWSRDLTAGEIVGQLLAARARLGARGRASPTSSTWGWGSPWRTTPRPPAPFAS